MLDRRKKYREKVEVLCKNISIADDDLNKFYSETQEYYDEAIRTLSFWKNLRKKTLDKEHEKLKTFIKMLISLNTEETDIKQKIEKEMDIMKLMIDVYKLIDQLGDVFNKIQESYTYFEIIDTHEETLKYINKLSDSKIEVVLYQSLQFKEIIKPIYFKDYFYEWNKVVHLNTFFHELQETTRIRDSYRKVFSSKKKYLPILRCINQEPYIKHSKLAENLSMSSQALTDYMKKLPDLGLLTKEERKGGSYYNLTVQGGNVIKNYLEDYNVTTSILRKENEKLKYQLDFLKRRNNLFYLFKENDYNATYTACCLSDNFSNYMMLNISNIYDDIYFNCTNRKKFIDCLNEEKINLFTYTPMNRLEKNDSRKKIYDCFVDLRNEKQKVFSENEIINILDPSVIKKYLNNQNKDDYIDGIIILFYGATLLKIDCSTFKSYCENKLDLNENISEELSKYFIINYDKFKKNLSLFQSKRRPIED